MRRILTDEHIRAHELYVQGGMQLIDIAGEVGVALGTLRSWSKKEDWKAQRGLAISTPQAIAKRLQDILIALMNQVDEKLGQGEIVSDLTLKRIDSITKSLARLDKNYDDKGSIILAMDRFIAYLRKRKDTILINAMNRTLPDFYRSLREEN